MIKIRLRVVDETNDLIGKPIQPMSQLLRLVLAVRHWVVDKCAMVHGAFLFRFWSEDQG